MTKRHCYVADVGAAIERLADALDPDRNKPFSGDILDLLEWAEKDVLDMRQRLEQAHADIAGLHDQLEEPQITQDEYKLELEQLRQQLAEWNEKAKNWMASPEAGKQLEGYRAMGVKCAELEAERDQLRQQLTSRDAEIERLKTVPMRYRRMAFNAQLQNENTQLRQQLADRDEQISDLTISSDTYFAERNSARDVWRRASKDRDELRQQLDTAWAQAHRLALELECLIMDTKDNVIVSKWWDSAFEAIEEYNKLKPGASEDAEAWAKIRKAGI